MVKNLQTAILRMIENSVRRRAILMLGKSTLYVPCADTHLRQLNGTNTALGNAAIRPAKPIRSVAGVGVHSEARQTGNSVAIFAHTYTELNIKNERNVRYVASQFKHGAENTALTSVWGKPIIYAIRGETILIGAASQPLTMGPIGMM